MLASLFLTLARPLPDAPSALLPARSSIACPVEHLAEEARVVTLSDHMATTLHEWFSSRMQALHAEGVACDVTSTPTDTLGATQQQAFRAEMRQEMGDIRREVREGLRRATGDDGGDHGSPLQSLGALQNPG